MSTNRTTTPGGVANLLSFQPVVAALRRGGMESTPLKTSQARRFWQQLLTGEPTNWPAVTGTLISLGQVAGGFVFTVEDTQGLLLLGAGALEPAGEAWVALHKIVVDTRVEATSSVLAAGGQDLVASWQIPQEIPDTAPWLVLVPMIGLRYYASGADQILQHATALGNDLLAIADLQLLPGGLS